MADVQLQQLETVKEGLKDTSRDLRLNLGTVLGGDTLTKEQAWGVALASAYYIREPRLTQAVLADAQANGVGEAVVQDAQAAAALMGMNTVYYRFRHMIHKDSYQSLPARLRMTWMGKPLTGKADFELFSLAVAALAGCEMCIKSHEGSILQHGLTEAHVHDAVRIAAVLNGVAVAMNS